MSRDTAGVRRMVVDLNAQAPAWRLPEFARQEIMDAAPPDWSVRVLSSLTVSDGDGGTDPAAEALEAIADAEVYVGFGITPALFGAARKLRWVHSAAAGVGGVLFPEMKSSEVLLTNSAGVHAIPMAEYVMAGVLHFYRGLDVAIQNQRRASWDRSRFVGENPPVRELGGSRVLVVGTGGIGRAVAERASALGMICTGVRRRPELGAPPGFEKVAGVDSLDELLPDADVLVLAAPLTSETGRLMGAARLDLLPSHAVVVNVARGALLEEAALLERLDDGRLRGAVLDVFDVEPLPADNSLWRNPRVLMTPHVSAVSPERFWERQLALLLDNWQRYREGRPLRNLVDKLAGY